MCYVKDSTQMLKIKGNILYFKKKEREKQALLGLTASGVTRAKIINKTLI